ncbi:hypothetical protein [Lactococcus formosensis]|uniref:hypothetical protein n=1 Tax=Lactococcus formosensis TaxID=1281486 RepID=UPI003265FFB3
MDALYIVQLVFWIAMLVVVIALFIKNMREARKYKKKMVELDKQREDRANERFVTIDEIPSSTKEELDQFRVIKAQTAYNGEKYFIEALHQGSKSWVTLESSSFDTYERALEVKLCLEQTQRDKIANTIVTKEVVE